MRSSLMNAILCFSASCLPIAAQQSEAGIQGAFVFPQSDLRSAVGGRAGFTVGVHSGIDLQGGNELRPRIDYTRIDGGSFSLSSLDSTTTVQGIGLGADYVSYLEDRRRGVYACGGVSLVWWTSDLRFGGTTRRTAPMFMIGAGHRFNSQVGMEFNLDYGSFRSSKGTASSLKAGMFYRF
jgi:hypothetical protein